MSINLLPQNLQKAQKHHNYKLVSVSLSLILLITLVATTAGLFAYRYVVSKQYKDIDKQANDLIAQINSKKNEEWYLRAITKKSVSAQKFLENRLPYDVIITKLQEKTNENLSIKDITIQDDSISLNGKTEVLSDLAVYLKGLAAQEGVFEKPRITTLRFSNKDYSYTFGLEIELSKNVKKALGEAS